MDTHDKIISVFDKLDIALSTLKKENTEINTLVVSNNNELSCIKDQQTDLQTKYENTNHAIVDLQNKQKDISIVLTDLQTKQEALQHEINQYNTSDKWEKEMLEIQNQLKSIQDKMNETMKNKAEVPAVNQRCCILQ